MDLGLLLFFIYDVNCKRIKNSALYQNILDCYLVQIVNTLRGIFK